MELGFELRSAFSPKLELLVLCPLAFTYSNASKHFGKVTDLMSSHLGLQVGKTLKSKGLLVGCLLSPTLLSALTLGKQFYA